MIRALRSIGGFIDNVVYRVVEWLFQLILDLANVEIFHDSVVDEFASRIYLILGLVMLFKIMISFIQILINPDKMNDKEQGVGNILKRVVISLALIFMVPSIFDFARSVQGEVIPIIPKVILGVELNADNPEEEQEMLNSTGRTMAFYSFMSFFNYANDACIDGSILGDGSGNDENLIIYDVASATRPENLNIKDQCNNGDFKYDYGWPMTLIIGAYLVWTLLSIAVKIAIRAIKLSVCEFVAPIPIASYIDPKSSKQSFDKWVSVSIKTYLDLFIRLIIVYFIAFVGMKVFDPDNLSVILANVGGSTLRKGLVILFIVVGLFEFAREAPKFLTDLLGLQGTGDYMGMFKGEGWKSLGKTLGTAGAAIGSGIGNARYAYKNSGMSKDKWWKKVGVGALAATRGVAGATAATGRGIVAQATGKGFKDTFTNNIRTTTGNSQRRVNKGAIKRASVNDRRDALNDIDNKISDTNYQFDQEARDLNARKNTMQARKNNLLNTIDSIDQKIATLQNQESYLQTRLANARRMGNDDDIEEAEKELDKNRSQLNNLFKNYNSVNEQIHNVDKNIDSINDSINGLDNRRIEAINKLEKSKDEVPGVITPVRNAIAEAFNTFTGMQSISGASILKASSDLASIRSAYYTGEAMKKLTEEGSKIKDKLSMGATYSEVASAYDALRNGSVDKVYINNKEYTSADIQTVGEMFKTAEKEAAIKYINAVKEGKIKNSTLEEGFKQIVGALDGMGLDAQTKKKLLDEFDKDAGKFLKSLSDVSKRLETEGKRRQAYEREQKKGS